MPWRELYLEYSSPAIVTKKYGLLNSRARGRKHKRWKNLPKAFISTNVIPFFLTILNRGEQALIKHGFISFYPNESQVTVIFFRRFFFHLMKTLSPSFQSPFTKEHSRDIKVSLNEEVFLKSINTKRTMRRDPLILS